ncbi:MAG: hypothetical protein AOA65_1704 [Candidatus Bathyarchaeota archaeon BA1]|nr:MAG: hypothetical protein AOA65_1704 [Candidatus Bathyarchaeota archaeon BA1]
MKLLTVIYWSRVGLGILAALICVALGVQSFLTGLSLGMLVYLLTGHILRRWFGPKVEKPSKLVTVGIGAYFLTWLVSWILLYTLLHPIG